LRKTAIAIFCVIIVTSGALPLFVNADWSMFRSDAARSGVGTCNSTGRQVLTPTLLWKTNLQWNLTEWNRTLSEGLLKERDWTEPAVVGNVVYVGVYSIIESYRYDPVAYLSQSQRIDVYAFNSTDGSEIWNYRDDSCYEITSPAVVNGTVYFSTNSYTSALNASDGSLLWKYPAGTYRSNPAVAYGMVYFGTSKSGKGALVALDAASGQSIWSYINNETTYSFSTPAVANGVVCAGSYHQIRAVDAYTGDGLWDYQFNMNPIGPAIANGIAYALKPGRGVRTLSIYAFDAINGTKIWNNTISYDKRALFSSGELLAVTNDVIYSSYLSDELYALNASSGTIIWNYTLEGARANFQFFSAPTIVKGTVYVNSNDTLYAFNAKNGEMLWNCTLSDSVSSSLPVVVNNVEYVSSGQRGYRFSETQLYAIAIPPPLASSELPQTEPFPTMPVAFVIAVVIIAVAVAVGLLLYFKKRKH